MHPSLIKHRVSVPFPTGRNTSIERNRDTLHEAKRLLANSGIKHGHIQVTHCSADAIVTGQPKKATEDMVIRNKKSPELIHTKHDPQRITIRSRAKS